MSRCLVQSPFFVTALYRFVPICFGKPREKLGIHTVYCAEIIRYGLRVKRRVHRYSSLHSSPTI